MAICIVCSYVLTCIHQKSPSSFMHIAGVIKLSSLNKHSRFQLQSILFPALSTIFQQHDDRLVPRTQKAKTTRPPDLQWPDAACSVVAEGGPGGGGGGSSVLMTLCLEPRRGGSDFVGSAVRPPVGGSACRRRLEYVLRAARRRRRLQWKTLP